MDNRRKCFGVVDIAKVIVLINKIKTQNIAPMLEQAGLDGLWKQTFPKEQIGDFLHDRPLHFSSYDLLNYLKTHKIYFAELLSKLNCKFVPISQATAVSYSWKRSLIQICFYMADRQKNK